MGIKVAIIEPVGGHGGMNYYDFGLLDGLELAGMAVSLYTCDATEIPEKNIHCTYCFFKRIYGKSPKAIRFLRFIVGLLKSLGHARINGAKLVHYHIFQYSLLEFLEVVATRFLGMRFVLTVHDVESFSSKKNIFMTKFILRRAQGIVVHNTISNQSVLNLVPEAVHKISIIPHGNYLEHVKEAPSLEDARKILGIPFDSQVALFFGQIKKVKGLDILLHAWKDVVKNNSKALLVVAGRLWKEDFKYYLDITEQCCLENSVKFDIRYIPDDEALLYYSAADVIVLPYRKIYQSGVLLMALSHAKAVVVSNLPGMTEVIKDCENGFVFRDGDTFDLSVTITRILSNADLRAAAAFKGLDTVTTQHDWYKIGEITKAFYEKTSLS